MQLTDDIPVSFLFLRVWCTVQPGSAVLSLVFCAGKANDSDPELVVPELESTSSIISTGVVSTVRLFRFLLLPLALASGNMLLVELLGVLPYTTLVLSSDIINMSFGFMGILLAGVTAGALLCLVLCSVGIFFIFVAW